MTQLVSLKQKYSDSAPKAGSDDDAYYPSIYLEEKQIKALGLEALTVGTKMTMTATVSVSSWNENEGGNNSMSFKFIEAAVEPIEKKPDAASVLFPNG